MDTLTKSLTKEALECIYNFFERNGKDFLFHNYDYVLTVLKTFKEISKNEGLRKEDIEMAKLALLFKDIGIVGSQKPDWNNQQIIDDFLATIELTPTELKEFKSLIQFIRKDEIPRTKLERVLKDSADIHLALPDSLEGLSLLRMEEGRLYGKLYNDTDWIERCKAYFVTHGFHTDYAKRTYGSQRSRNFLDLEHLAYKVKNDEEKQNRVGPEMASPSLNFKETEELFKIAFRNYGGLVTVADRKAILMIHVNSIIISVIFAFTVRGIFPDPLFLLPIGITLVIALATIFLAILASRPQEEVQKQTSLNGHEGFFFGSFDRVDNDFIKTTWNEYQSSMLNIANGNQAEVMKQITEETFTVRKVLAQKFKYISLSYKVFTFGLLIAIASFIFCYLIQI